MVFIRLSSYSPQLPRTEPIIFTKYILKNNYHTITNPFDIIIIKAYRDDSCLFNYHLSITLLSLSSPCLVLK